MDAWLSSLDSLAPLDLAADWDNVGLLVEGNREVQRVLLCIDLTAAVHAEVERLDADLVVAYHPPIFDGLRRLRTQTARGRVLLSSIRAGRHIYSPHTALDAVPGGVNDWLLEGFGTLVDVRPIEPAATNPAAGAGRRARLATPLDGAAVVPRIAAHLGLTTLRVAGAVDAVRSVAVCPGAGGSLLRSIRDVDLLLTGEMRHHDVLACAEAGVAVVLTDHTNTERGYLPRYAQSIRAALPRVEVHVSGADRDPLVPWSAA
ncbi:MAG: Nif3-like dinuclear metal center hexameric protein [Myxococcota bacterium]